jgi:hypothetical protein
MTKDRTQRVVEHRNSQKRTRVALRTVGYALGRNVVQEKKAMPRPNNVEALAHPFAKAINFRYSL